MTRAIRTRATGHSTSINGAVISMIGISHVRPRASQSIRPSIIPRDVPWSWIDSTCDIAVPESQAVLHFDSPAPR